MAPTLEDQDRLIVNKLVYRIGEPRRGDIVMLYYPLNPDKSFVKRVIAEEGDTVRIVDGRVYVNDVPLHDDYVPQRVPQPRRLGPAGDSRGLLLRDGRPPEQQLRQPALGLGAEEVHHRQGAAALVAAPEEANASSSRIQDSPPEPRAQKPSRASKLPRAPAFSLTQRLGGRARTLTPNSQLRPSSVPDPPFVELLDEARQRSSTTWRRTFIVGVNSSRSMVNSFGSTANRLTRSNCASVVLSLSSTAW